MKDLTPIEREALSTTLKHLLLTQQELRADPFQNRAPPFSVRITGAGVFRGTDHVEYLSVIDEWLKALAPRGFEEQLRRALNVLTSLESLNAQVDSFAALVGQCLGSEHETFLQVRAVLYEQTSYNAMAFSIALGRGDDKRACLQALTQDVEQGVAPDVLSAYLTGRFHQHDDVNALMERWTDGPLLRAKIATVARIGPDSAQCEWLAEQLSTIGDTDVRWLFWGLWARVEREAMLRFINAALRLNNLTHFELAARRTALGLDTSPADPAWLAMARQVIESARAPGYWNVHSAVYLTPIGKQLADAGDAQLVCEVVAKSISGVSHPDDPGSLREIVEHCGRTHPVVFWDALSEHFEPRRQDQGVLLLIENQFAQFAPTANVVRWMGRDVKRARWVAEWVVVDGDVMPTLLRELVHTFGTDTDVASTLYERFMGGSQRRSSVERLQESLVRVRQWHNANAGVVKSWLARCIVFLEREQRRRGYLPETPRRTGS